MGRVWDAAIAQDSWPDLATHGKTGTSGRRIALTFDDGPDQRTTPRILDSLREQDLEATFFVLGRHVKKSPGLLRRIVKEGHTIGNHTYNHTDMSDLNQKRMRLELRRTQAAVDDALGYHYPMVLMRPPYGNPYFDGSDALPVFRKVVRDQGLFPILWTVDPRDYMLGGRPEDVLRGTYARTRQGEKGRGTRCCSCTTPTGKLRTHCHTSSTTTRDPAGNSRPWASCWLTSTPRRRSSPTGGAP